MSASGQSASHPVKYEVAYQEQRNRLTTFFRFILVIPHVILLALWGIAVYVTTILAWFAILVTGRFPAGLWSFAHRYLVYSARVNGYSGLLSDVYPPFGSDGDYPVRVTVEAPDRHSRLTTFFRSVLVIPALLGLYLLGIAQNVVTLLAWIVIVFTGRMPLALQNFIVFVHRFSIRTTAYILLLVDAYPSFADDDAPAANPQEPAAAAW
jgi:hypothetical protein